jgi:RNA polymerase sigma-70 factor (ECF subfamily)
LTGSAAAVRPPEDAVRAPAAMTERDLARRCRQGDPAALRDLAETYYDRVHRVARTLVRDPETAEDLTQEAFTAALKSIRAFRGESQLFTWLVSILRNRWFNRRRKDRRLQVYSEVNPGPDPEDRIARSDSVGDLRDVFHRLGEEDRLVLELFHYEEMKYHEIARATGVPVGTVKSRLFTARQKLKDLMEGRHEV